MSIPSSNPVTNHLKAQFELDNQKARAMFPGTDYQTWLSSLHRQLRPSWYCEIGIESGRTLALAGPDTHAIGVDPAFQIAHTLRARTRLYRMTSDEFFSAGHLDAALGSQRLDFGFVDGLHHFDQALRDFIHLETRSHPGALILFHDVLPISERVASRDRNSLFWSGDTFKAMLVLADLRPDLNLAILPCFPSGLGLVTNLTPAAADINAHLSAAIKHRLRQDFSSALDEMRQRVTILSNNFASLSGYLAHAD